MGLGYIDKIAAPAVQEVVKSVTARHNAEDLIIDREQIRNEIAQELINRMRQRNIIVEIVNITNFQFSAEFTKAIEAKVVAQQNVLQAQYRLQQVQVEAQQAEAKAKGEAAALIANAQGQATSIQIVTDAQVAANQKIAASLNKDVLQYVFIDRLGKDIKVVVIPSGQNFVLGDLVQP